MGNFLSILELAEKNLVNRYLDDPEGWNTLDVDYEPPRVERLWRDLDGAYRDHRLYLHKIHPCETALYHPHPWPSAIKILHGSYEMNIGYGTGHEAPPTAATLILTKDSSYEMVDPNGWHYVRPFGKHPSYSIMVTGPKWDRWSPKPKADHKLGPLTPEAKASLLTTFGAFYGR